MQDDYRSSCAGCVNGFVEDPVNPRGECLRELHDNIKQYIAIG